MRNGRRFKYVTVRACSADQSHGLALDHDYFIKIRMKRKKKQQQNNVFLSTQWLSLDFCSQPSTTTTINRTLHNKSAVQPFCWADKISTSQTSTSKKKKKVKFELTFLLLRNSELWGFDETHNQKRKNNNRRIDLE